MREYETTIIVQPEISEEGTEAILSRLDQSLESQGAIRLMCEDLGKRKLAYEIRKFHKGHYYLLSYLDEGRTVREIERLMRMDESVLRFLTVQVSEEVSDIEARRAEAKEQEVAQQKRAAERAAREAEEAEARAEAERLAAEEAAAAEPEPEPEADDTAEPSEGKGDAAEASTEAAADDATEAAAPDATEPEQEEKAS